MRLEIGFFLLSQKKNYPKKPQKDLKKTAKRPQKDLKKTFAPLCKSILDV